MPLKRSAKHQALKELLKANPTNPKSDLMHNNNIIPTSVLDRVAKDYINYNYNYNTSQKKSIIDCYVNNNTITCYGSTTTSGWGSFPSSDTASFGGSGTEGAIQG